MENRVAIVGSGVSGLTCGVLFAKSGLRTAIFAEQTGHRTTSAVAAALWYPYDAEPADKVIPWALETFKVLVDLTRDQRSGVSMIELRTFSRTSEIQIPEWAIPLGARRLSSSDFSITVPLMDTTIYLDYLANRFGAAGGNINADVRLTKLEKISRDFDLVVNC